MRFKCALLATLLSTLAFAQAPSVSQPTTHTGSAPASQAIPLSQDQIRQLIRESADHDMANDKMQRDYTYVEREEDHRVDGKGRVKSTEIKTYDVMEIYGEQVQKLVSKNDKPLSPKEARKEDEKIQKLIDKRRKESAADREKRLQKEEKDREDGRKFVGEVADAYNFRYVGMESLDGRENYVIDADPRPDYKPHLKDAKILPKFRFRAWIDKDETQWRKLDIQCIDTVSFGLFLLRVHKGSRIVIEQTRVNNEVWLQKHIALNADFRLALLKNFAFNVDITDRDYRKFGSNTKIIMLGEAHDRQ
ncbi:MAG TPA: hypothetical protein VJQ50_18610 [Terriglobales bacterium]|nr:hypothetical protein [Terriglobales bacterium]